MKKKKDIVNIIFKISELVRKISVEDFEYLEDMVENQKNYYNPLKMATTKNQHKLADHNEKMINILRELKQLVDKGE